MKIKEAFNNTIIDIKQNFIPSFGFAAIQAYKTYLSDGEFIFQRMEEKYPELDFSREDIYDLHQEYLEITKNESLKNFEELEKKNEKRIMYMYIQEGRKGIYSY